MCPNLDNRTGKTYTIPIEHNSIPATAFKQLKMASNDGAAKGNREEDEVEGGLRVYDPGQLERLWDV